MNQITITDTSRLEALMIDIHNALLTTQCILLSPDMSKDMRDGLYELAVKQLDNNAGYMKAITSQIQHGIERKE